MIINKHIKLFLSLCILLSFTSCIVPKKKYDDTLVKKVRAEGERDSLQTELDRLKGAHEIATSANTQDRETIQKLEKDIKELQAKIKKLEAENKTLNNSLENLQTHSGRLDTDLARQRADLLKAEERFELTRVENEKLSHDLKEREEKVKALEKVIADKEKAVNDLKNKISQSLLNFKENDLSVNVKNGKVYVSLAEQLLFKSGSTSVDPKGIQALKQLAGALKQSGDINVLIEGHTDDVPVSKISTYMNDNWDLSVMRATAISRILIASGVEPEKITAAGRSQYFPVEKAKSAEARQKNRRTEIILTPKLDELFQILEAN